MATPPDRRALVESPYVRSLLVSQSAFLRAPIVVLVSFRFVSFRFVFLSEQHRFPSFLIDMK